MKGLFLVFCCGVLSWNLAAMELPPKTTYSEEQILAVLIQNKTLQDLVAQQADTIAQHQTRIDKQRRVISELSRKIEETTKGMKALEEFMTGSPVHHTDDENLLSSNGDRGKDK